jgi:hypothetical protein
LLHYNSGNRNFFNFLGFTKHRSINADLRQSRSNACQASTGKVNLKKNVNHEAQIGAKDRARQNGKSFSTSAMILGQQLIADVISLWRSLVPSLPKLAPAALASLAVPSASVNVERSFSIYKTILADNRHSLKRENMKMLFILKFNAASGGL